MKAIFGVLSLLIVVAVVGTLVKKQLAEVSTIHMTPQETSPMAAPASAPGGQVRQQSQQIQQQVKQSIEASMQQARPVPEDN